LLLYLSLVLIGTGAFAAAVAERARITVTFVGSILLAGVVFPVAGKWAWNGGWLAEMGFRDEAGAAVLHAAVGAAALVSAALVGARSGKYNRDRCANFIPGHSMVMKQIGMLVMLIAWVPYVSGAAASHAVAFRLSTAATNVLIAAAAGSVVSLLVGRLRYGKPDILLAGSGLIGGAVAITACAATCSSAWAAGIGAVAGLVVPFATIYIDTRLKIDDPGSIAAIHGVGGIWGAAAAGLATGVDWSDRISLLAVQVMGALAIVAMAVLVVGSVLLIMRATMGIRAGEADEFDGLDLAEHDVNAYPDFQQTTIKSYHLREA
jgi:ammonium transporter, Amt family